MNKPYKVVLETFEGPLDLLLHLVHELKIDIYDIPVATITDQYMRYIHTMKQIELNIASEYLVMAATLLEMKSAMLLPKKEAEHIDEYEEDPRETLVERLIEYRKYKEVAAQLKEKELAGHQLYMRTPQTFLTEKQPPAIKEEKASLDVLLDAFDRLLQRKSWEQPLETKISRTDISVEDRMVEVIEFLSLQPGPIPFEDLFPYHTNQHIVTTFLVLLHLLGNNQIYCEQNGQFKPIFVSLVVEESCH